MHSTQRCRRLPAAITLAVAATTAAPVSAGDALDPSAVVPPITVRSALSTHRPFDEAPPLPWREANDAVGRIGGWRAYAREAAAAVTPAAASPASAPGAASAPGHGGHPANPTK